MNNYVFEKFELETLSPIAIKSGESYAKLEYLVEGDKIKIYEKSKIFSTILQRMEVNKAISLLSKNVSLQEIINLLLIKTSDVENFKILELKKGKTFDVGNQIDTFLRHPNGKVYIPGSSIKGALRTPFYFNLLKLQQPIHYSALSKKLKEIISLQNSKTNFLVKDIEGNFETVCEKIYRLPKMQLNNVEVLNIKDKIEVEIGLKNIEPSELITTVNNFYLTIVDDYLDVINENKKKMYVSADKFNKLEEFFRYLKGRIEKEKGNTLFMQIGWGGGYYSKSIGSIFRKDDKWLINMRKFFKFGLKNKQKSVVPFPQTITVIKESNDFYTPLGWVCLKWCK